MTERSNNASGIATKQTGAVQDATEPPVAFKRTCAFWKVGEEGLSHWEARRSQWTKGGLAIDTPHVTDRRRLGKLWKHAGSRDISRSNLEKVYTLCVEERKAFSRPINLAEIIPVLISGWQKNGTWPEGQVAPPDST